MAAPPPGVKDKKVGLPGKNTASRISDLESICARKLSI